MDELWLELGLSLLLVVVFMAFLAWLNRRGYAQNLFCLQKIAKEEALKVVESPTGGALFSRAQYEAQYQGSSAQYAHLRGPWRDGELELRSIRRRGRPFATRLTIFWSAAQSLKLSGVLLLCPKGSAARYGLKLSTVPLTGAFGQAFDLLADDAAWALRILDEPTRAYLLQQRNYLRGPLFLSAKMLYTEEAGLILNPPDMEAIKARLRIIKNLANAIDKNINNY